jgi:hypothetical protein
MRLLQAAILTCLASGLVPAQRVYEIPDGVETRWASPENPLGQKGKAGQENAGRKGRPAIDLKAGAQLVLAEVHNSSGTVRRIWATIDKRTPQVLRGMRIDMYWDEAAKPAVSAPFGDFFGTGLGRMATFQSAAFASPEGRSFNCYLPMPFRRAMKIVVTNESAENVTIFYDVDYTLGDHHDANALYFHAYYHRENPTRMQRDYEILPKLAGKGRYLGANLGVIANKKLYSSAWWGEGEVKVYLDGDNELPTLSGTGTEDYIGTGWGQGQYALMYSGSHVADHEHMRYCFYRYHLPDPIYFRNDVRVTIQQIGYRGSGEIADLHKAGQPVYKAGEGRVEMGTWQEGIFEREDDWSSVAYFYLDRPSSELPALDPLEARTAGLQ